MAFPKYPCWCHWRKLTLVLASLTCAGQGRRIPRSSALDEQNVIVERLVEAPKDVLQPPFDTSGFRPPPMGGRQSVTMLSLMGAAAPSTVEMQQQSQRPAWPDRARCYRYIELNDPTFEEYTSLPDVGFVCDTPTTFQGTRREGTYHGSCRLQFTVNDQCRTIELLRSKEDDKPSFGAVKIRSPVGFDVASKKSRLIVSSLEREGSAEKAQIRKGDIIRAISQGTSASSGKQGMFGLMGGTPDAENGMIMLDGKSKSDFDMALEAQGELVLLVERPVKWGNSDDDDWNVTPGGGLGERVRELFDNLGSGQPSLGGMPR